MAVTLAQARSLLAARDRSFVACDLDAYLSLWDVDCTVEGPAHRIEGRESLGKVIEVAWSLQRPLHMQTLSVGAGGDLMFSEFAIVWESRAGGDRALQTGSTICEVGPSGRWSWLREYFDPSDRIRRSVADRPGFAALLKR